MKDFYAILGVRKDATLAEIKHAYRKKAKSLHPDSAGGVSNREEFNQVVKAYRVLSDARQRSVFDESNFFRTRHSAAKNEQFDYYKWLSDRTDEESRAKLIFYTLMHQKEDEAVAEFKRMQLNHADFSLRKWFSREDFMDYGYILAEELVFRSEYYDAIILLEQIIRLEHSYHYFYIFFPEVMEFTLDILKKHIDGVLPDELALDVFERALELGFGSSEDSFFLGKMAEEYGRMGDAATAGICRAESDKLAVANKNGSHFS